MLLTRLCLAALALLSPALAIAQGPPATAGQPQTPSLLTLAPPVQALASPETSAIVDALERYFKGFDAMDPDLMSSAVHPDAVMAGGVGQPSVETSAYSRMFDQLRKMRGKMTPPAVKAERTLTEISLRGDLATAFVHMTYLPPTRGAGVPIEYAFQFYRTGGRWTIVSVLNHAGQYAGETDDKTLDVMGVRPGMTIGEIGAGSGRVTLSLARRAGDRGKVYANDIDETALAQLRTVCERRGVKNVETLVGKVDDPMFPKGALDLAITAIVYHHLEQPVALLRNLASSLKPGATLVIVDPAYDRTGDKDSARPTTRERVETEAAEAGYELVAMNASLPRDNIFILRVKTGGRAGAPKIATAPWTPPQPGSERAAVLAAVDTWWKGHDADDAALLEKILAPGARSWFVQEGALQFVTFDKDIERMKSGNRRPATRPLPGEKRTVVDFRQESAVATVTMLVEIPRAGDTSRCYTTFQLYKADDVWQIVNQTRADRGAGLRRVCRPHAVHLRG
jgi:SAM-dependent methyltransferase